MPGKDRLSAYSNREGIDSFFSYLLLVYGDDGKMLFLSVFMLPLGSGIFSTCTSVLRSNQILKHILLNCADFGETGREFGTFRREELSSGKKELAKIKTTAMFGRKKEKIFCIGRNKTGTTSLEKALEEFGYKMGNQPEGEVLIKYYRNYDWKPIIKFCKTAEAFQDAPFSYPYTWLILHEHFPNAKFILTTRNEEDWYRSSTNFHAKKFSDGKTPPNKQELQEATYRYKGFMWDVNRAVWKTPEDDVYNKEMFLENYRTHNTAVLNFFKGNPNFLHLDLTDTAAYRKLAAFLGKKPLREGFPHLNKTEEIK